MPNGGATEPRAKSSTPQTEARRPAIKKPDSSENGANMGAQGA